MADLNNVFKFSIFTYSAAFGEELDVTSAKLRKRSAVLPKQHEETENLKLIFQKSQLALSYSSGGSQLTNEKISAAVRVPSEL